MNPVVSVQAAQIIIISPIHKIYVVLHAHKIIFLKVIYVFNAKLLALLVTKIIQIVQVALTDTICMKESVLINVLLFISKT